MTPTTMLAWRAESLGEPGEVMALRRVPVPRAGAGEVLLRVRGAALGFPDALMCRGSYQARPDLPFTPGAEVCGEVVGTGRRVAAVLARGHGALAQFAVADERHVYPVPDVLTDGEAAALMSAYTTAWFGLHVRGRLAAGEVVVVLAAAGGVGSAAVQVARAAGARVIGVTRDAAKAQVVRELGADVAIDSTTEPVVERIRAETAGRGADVVFDPVGGAAFHDATRYVAFRGRILVVGFAAGDVQSLRLNRPLLRGFDVVGVNVSLHVREEPHAVRAAMADIAALCEQRQLRPFVSAEVDMTQAAAQLQRVAVGVTTGRVVVDPWDEG
jgi:NADPH:quinone reductase